MVYIYALVEIMLFTKCCIWVFLFNNTPWTLKSFIKTCSQSSYYWQLNISSCLYCVYSITLPLRNCVSWWFQITALDLDETVQILAPSPGVAWPWANYCFVTQFLHLSNGIVIIMLHCEVWWDSSCKVLSTMAYTN